MLFHRRAVNARACEWVFEVTPIKTKSIFERGNRAKVEVKYMTRVTGRHETELEKRNDVH